MRKLDTYGGNLLEVIFTSDVVDDRYSKKPELILKVTIKIKDTYVSRCMATKYTFLKDKCINKNNIFYTLLKLFNECLTVLYTKKMYVHILSIIEFALYKKFVNEIFLYELNYTYDNKLTDFIMLDHFYIAGYLDFYSSLTNPNEFNDNYFSQFTEVYKPLLFKFKDLYNLLEDNKNLIDLFNQYPIYYDVTNKVRDDNINYQIQKKVSTVRKIHI